MWTPYVHKFTTNKIKWSVVIKNKVLYLDLNVQLSSLIKNTFTECAYIDVH